MAQTKTRQTRHQLSLITAHSGEASEQRINHCVRGERIKRHKRNETERKACINTRTIIQVCVCVCVCIAKGQVWRNKVAAIQLPDTTMSHPGCCSYQTCTSGNSWEQHMHTNTFKLYYFVHNCASLLAWVQPATIRTVFDLVNTKLEIIPHSCFPLFTADTFVTAATANNLSSVALRLFVETQSCIKFVK